MKLWLKDFLAGIGVLVYIALVFALCYGVTSGAGVGQ